MGLRIADLTYKTARRIVITLVGFTVLAIGVVMLVFPGPALVVIPVGLAILGVEWAWARRLLSTVAETSGEALARIGLRERLHRIWPGRRS